MIMPMDPRELPPGVARNLNLTITDLAQLLDTLKRAEAAKIRFDGELITGNHRVGVRWVDDQREGTWLVVTSIRHA